MFLKYLGKVEPMVFRNNLEIIIGSISERFENTEAGQKLGILAKHECVEAPIHRHSRIV